MVPLLGNAAAASQFLYVAAVKDLLCLVDEEAEAVQSRRRSRDTIDTDFRPWIGAPSAMCATGFVKGGARNLRGIFMPSP